MAGRGCFEAGGLLGARQLSAKVAPGSGCEHAACATTAQRLSECGCRGHDAGERCVNHSCR
jgi:hypothetical protein